LFEKGPVRSRLTGSAAWIETGSLVRDGELVVFRVSSWLPVFL
jgi:hypothetical protein